MKKFFLTILALVPMIVSAQEQTWLNITALHFAATGGEDPDNTLQQYLLMNEGSLTEDSPLYRDYRTFAEEFGQMQKNRIMPEGMKEADESIEQIKKMIEEHPEMADELKAQIKIIEDVKKEMAGMMTSEEVSFSVDPKQILKELTKLAVNKKAYTGWRDIEGGLYAVTEAPRFGPVDEGVKDHIEVPEASVYTWGAIDTKGKQVIEPKYISLHESFAEHDVLFLHCKTAAGKDRYGVLGYDGRVRIPFEYEEIHSYNLEKKTAAMVKGGKIGILSFDGKQLQPFEYASAFHMGFWLVRKADNGSVGIVSADGLKLIPLKYKDYWDCVKGEIFLVRSDGRLDVYNEETCEFLRTDPKPEQ